MKRCLILTGGKLSLAFAGSFLKEHKFEKVVAVDGGLEAAKELDIIPDVIVGDFDTVHPEILAYYRKMEHIVWEVHQPEKDDTDTELAIKPGSCHELQPYYVIRSYRRKVRSYDRKYPSAVSVLAKRYLCRDRRLPEPSVSDRRGAYLPKGRDLGKVYLFPAPYRRSKGDHVKRL